MCRPLVHRLALSALLCIAAPTFVQAQSSPIAIDPTAATQASLIGALQGELPPGTAVVGFGEWNETPIAPAVALLRGTVLLDCGAAAPVPLRFDATLDTERQDVVSLSYRLTGDDARAPEQDTVLADAVAARIGAQLRQEFADQPVRFALTGLTAIRRTPRATIVQGHGTADFDREGTADVTFVATFDHAASTLHALQYDLAAPASDADWTTTAVVE